jgi:protein-tyrosine phosphatase
MAEASGTTDIVATPHANSQYQFSPAVIEQRIAELTGRSRVRIHRGCDFHLQVDNINDALKHPDKYTVNHKQYLLVEFPDFNVFSSSDQILGRLLDRGLVPIVTHPERNALLAQRLSDLAAWVQNGCYLQITAGSFTGRFGKGPKDAAVTMLHKGLVHFIASDAHDIKYRTTNLQDAYDRLSEEYGEHLVRPLFVDNPRAVITGGHVDFELPPVVARRRKWYQFWG